MVHHIRIHSCICVKKYVQQLNIYTYFVHVCIHVYAYMYTCICMTQHACMHTVDHIEYGSPEYRQIRTHTHIYTCTQIHIYTNIHKVHIGQHVTYISFNANIHTHIHTIHIGHGLPAYKPVRTYTHKHIYIYIYIYMRTYIHIVHIGHGLPAYKQVHGTGFL
jgi:hypothetical protein